MADSQSSAAPRNKARDKDVEYGNNSFFRDSKSISKLTSSAAPTAEGNSQRQKDQVLPLARDHGKETPQLRFITTTNPEQVKRSKIQKQVRSHVARRHHVVRQQAWRQEGQSQETASQSSGRLSITLGSGGTDPFNSWPLNVTPRMNILIDHFLSVVGPEMTSSITHSPTNNPIQTLYLPFSLSSPLVLHGLLLLSARSYFILSLDPSYNLTCLAHKVACIRLVNEALGVPNLWAADATIAAVLMLAVEEMLLGNREVFRDHLNGLKIMIGMRGGLGRLGLGGLLKELVLSCDRACEMLTGSDPLFEERESGSVLPLGFHRFL